ncbi:mucin-like protein [Protopterus annectens]|uniref:mucin-like protein n=1 Tax=Protopterus annectens TaxID=7888 RepID=UPI001CFA8297|nr:mucin-like protein [Protopterus annectens]
MRVSVLDPKTARSLTASCVLDFSSTNSLGPGWVLGLKHQCQVQGTWLESEVVNTIPVSWGLGVGQLGSDSPFVRDLGSVKVWWYLELRASAASYGFSQTFCFSGGGEGLLSSKKYTATLSSSALTPLPPLSLGSEPHRPITQGQPALSSVQTVPLKDARLDITPEHPTEDIPHKKTCKRRHITFPQESGTDFNEGKGSPRSPPDDLYFGDILEILRQKNINECDGKNVCSQVCINTVGSFGCGCFTGYSLNPADTTSCSDINECSTRNGGCSQLCVNSPGSYACDCNYGYTVNIANKSKCDDVNECLNNPCNHGSTCTNTPGSYSCTCAPGWTGQGCFTDIDECKSSPCMKGSCINTVGSFQCNCRPGWTGTLCNKDINECLSSPCLNGATCQDLENAFACVCRSGYTGLFCQTVIDNCASGPCQHGGVCVNSVNYYTCRCPQNWKGNNCEQDVDECSTGLSACDLNAVCTNTQGFYICTCKKGYEGNGFICREKRLYDYGPSFGDLRATIRTKDFVSPIIEMPMGFPFDTTFYYKCYFTDNGLIVFQQNEYEYQYSYPYPYSQFDKYYFYYYYYNTIYYSTPMIAAFWADADLSIYGEVYYQVYNFNVRITDNAQTFKNAIENAVKTYYGSQIGSQFTATWALKITWENVLPYTYYSAVDTSYTNTYQAVLVTDGVYSFCLMQFKDGGMNWRYQSLPSYYRPLMGYNSGQYPFTNSYTLTEMFPTFNDPLTRYSTSDYQRYHPDQYTGYNTQKKGLWAYRLERNTRNTINPRQKCLNWYYNEPYPYWYYYTPPCPCSYWQAIWDPSYTWGNQIKYVYGFAVKKPNEYYITMQNNFQNWYGGGVRCYYSWNGALLYGEKERFSPLPWTYTNFWYFWFYWWYQSWWYNYWYVTVPGLGRQYKENEVDPYNACCEDSRSSYFCNLYRQKRPLDYCWGYVPPRFGWFFGDPHITTLDNVAYTFNGLGEYILVNVKNSSELLFTLQGRTARAGRNATSAATNFVALAAYLQNGIPIQWNLYKENSTTLIVNGTEITISAGNTTYIGKATVEKTENETKVDFDGGFSVSVSAALGALSFKVLMNVQHQNNTEGLLGVFNGDPTDDFLTANGTHLPYDGKNLPNESQIYYEFGETWRTTQNNSVFTYNSSNGESWYTYNNQSFVPKFYEDLKRTSDPAKIQKANETCSGNDDCIFDILSTDDFAFGAATLKSVTSFIQQNSTVSNFPPNITGPSKIEAVVNTLVSAVYTADDPENDTVVFSLNSTSDDIQIAGNGTLVWYPNSSDSILATVIVKDSKGAHSELALQLVLCNCSNNATCVFSTSSLASGDNTNSNATFTIAACNCSEAYTGQYCTDDYDACLENQCYLNNTCRDNKAPQTGYTCGPCPTGLSGDGTKCHDIDECLENKTHCEQNCVNTLGGYNCTCDDGYHIDPNNSSACKGKTFVYLNMAMASFPL